MSIYLKILPALALAVALSSHAAQAHDSDARFRPPANLVQTFSFSPVGTIDHVPAGTNLIAGTTCTAAAGNAAAE